MIINECGNTFYVNYNKGEKMEIINRKKIYNNGFVEQWNFSDVIKSKQTISDALALVGSACRNVKIKLPLKFYDRLLTEHDGNPSEIFQFIPVEISINKSDLNMYNVNDFFRFGHFIKIMNNDNYYVFRTNLRNAIENKMNLDKVIINRLAFDFKVFRIKIPWMIVDHLRRHKMLTNIISENWQSNRTKHKIEYYYPQNELQKLNISETKWNDILTKGDIESIQSIKIRPELINKGEFGLRYVTGWISYWITDNKALDSFYGVRLKNPTQYETKILARTMYDLINME